jgi:hypothetical protein
MADHAVRSVTTKQWPVYVMNVGNLLGLDPRTSLFVIVTGMRSVLFVPHVANHWLVYHLSYDNMYYGSVTYAYGLLY